MSITRAEQMSMKPVLAADSVGASAASVVMPGGIGVSSSSVRCGWVTRVARCRFGRCAVMFRRSDEGERRVTSP